MARRYVVASAEGQRAPFNMTPEARDEMLANASAVAKRALAELTERGENKKEDVIAVTHNGKFHVDEVTATAVLRYVYRDDNFEVVRSRDQTVIDKADIVYDVGGVYDHLARRYDHHQNGALRRENGDGLTYSALGLIWLHYGEAYCDGNTRVAERIDQVLVRGIDARDNAELKVTHDADTPDYGISQVIEQLNPILENGEDYDTQFVKAVGRAAAILARIKEKVVVELDVEDAILSAREESTDPRYAVIDHQITPPDNLATIEGLEYIVFPEHTNNTWQVYTIRTPEDPFVSKRPFPAEWAGLMNDELVNATGVADALFCHSKRFLAVAKSKEGAIELLTKALQ